MNSDLPKAYRGTENYVFISYAHKDGPDVYPAIRALAAKGCRVWYDEGIEAGDDWAQKIGTSLERAALVLFFASKISVKRDNVLRELTLAKELGIPVLTVQLGRVALPDDLKRMLLVEQTVDLGKFATYGAFVDGITPVLEKYGLKSKPVGTFEDQKVSFQSRRKTGKVVSITVAAIAAVALICFGVFRLLFRTVPQVVGLDSASAQAAVEEADFTATMSMNYSDDYDYGVVFQQSAEGINLRFIPVVLTQSLGPQEDLTDVPDTVGRHVSDGAALLVSAGMTKFTIQPEVSETVELAHISAQSIPAGLRVSRKNNMDLTVATDGGELTFELNGQLVTITGTEAVTVDTSSLSGAVPEPANTPEPEEFPEPSEEPEESPEPTETPEPTPISLAVDYLKETYGTTLFDAPEDTATFGLLRQSLIQLYGLSRSYVYAGPADWPSESSDYFLPGNDPDSDTLMSGMAVYAAIKVHDPSIVADWSSVDLEASDIYPGVLVALDTAQRSGIITAAQNRVFAPFGTAGDLALLLANADRAFASGRVSTPPPLATPTPTPSEPVVESELLTALGLTGKTASELLAMDVLDARRSKTTLAITDADLNELVERMPNLDVLILNGQQISDMTPLLSLTKLEGLDLTGNPISSVAGISALTHLTGLYLNNTQVSDLSETSSLYLNDFTFANTNVTVIPQLAVKENLQLDARENKITDVSALASVTSFDQLLIDDMTVAAMLPVLAGKPIGELNGGYKDLYSFTQLAGLQARKLDMCWSENLTSLEGCENLTATTILNLKFCHALTDLTPLLNMPNLELLQISSDMSDLASQLDGSGIRIEYDNG